MSIFLANNSRLALTCLTLLAVSGCAELNQLTLPEPLPEPGRAQAPTSLQPEEPKEKADIERSRRLPVLQVSSSVEAVDKRWEGLNLPEGDFDLNVEAIPLERFFHVALGDVLGLSFELDPVVSTRKDPVTLRVSKPVNAERLLGMIEQVAANYDVGIAWDNGVLQVLPASKLLNLPPALVKGGSSAILGSQERVMTVIPLSYAAPSEVLNFVRYFVSVGQSGDVQVLPRLNAIVAIGRATNVERLKSAISLVDRPAMAGRHLSLIRAIYWQASDLAPHLEDALKLQGFAVAKTAGEPGVFVSPIEQLNALLVATPEKRTLTWIKDWINELDTPEVAGDSTQSFVYFAQHSTAEELGGVLSSVIGDVTNPSGKDDRPASSEPDDNRSNSGSNSQKLDTGLRIVIDKQHNSLVFVGNAQDYRIAYQLLQKLDVPVRQVLIEVTIADITLGKSNQLGVEWQDRNFGSDGILDNVSSTFNGLGLGSAGLTLTAFDSTGSVRARLNALATKGDAKILSSPKLLAVDNEEARIQVGTQIAIISSEIADSSGNVSDTGVVRSFNYVDTGVILQFTPTVMANGVVRMRIYQEVSSPGPSANNTPPISKRSIETTLVAETGETIMLGGLITRNTTKQDTQVPLLGDIPVLGSLFRNRSTTDDTSEMIILITPHVIESGRQAQALTEAYRAQLEWEK